MTLSVKNVHSVLRQTRKLAGLPALHYPSMAEVIDIIEQMESGGDCNAMGDLGKAYGLLQIRQGALDDANLWMGEKWRLKDMLGDEGVERSKKVFEAYMARYATPARLGREVMATDMAGIWNGGPWGFRKTATRGYREKFRRLAVAKFGESVVV